MTKPSPIARDFRPGAFAPFGAALAAPPPPLTLADLRASPLADLASTLVMDLGGRTGAVTYLRGVRDEAAVRASLAGLPDVHWFEQRAFLNEIFAAFRDQTVRQAALGSLMVLPILMLRYRGLRRALAAFLPSVLSGLVVVSTLAALGHPVNLLHVVSLLVVMGMGVDFGIYLVDSVEGERALGATLISILVCCLSTLLTFGALALSSHPALRAIGGSSLTDPAIPVREGAPAEGVVPSSYVPFRNAHLLAAATSWAEVLGATAVFVGAVWEDSSGYPDCRPEFYRAYEEAIRLGTRPETRIRVVTPVIGMSKADIVRTGLALGAPFDKTWSCYQDEEAACGVCESCRLRLAGWAPGSET